MTNYQKRKEKNDEYRSKIMRFTFQLSLGDGEVRDWFEQQPEKGAYPNTRSEAMARGEVFEWMASRDRTLTCAGAFEKGATNAYNDGKLPAFLKEWTAAYGKDRCMFVLACTMAQRTGDERFYPPARQAAGRFAALQKQMGGHTDVYAVDNHSCVINAAMEQLAKPERSVERKAVKKDAPER